jgi:hypothetical protein
MSSYGLIASFMKFCPQFGGRLVNLYYLQYTSYISRQTIRNCVCVMIPPRPSRSTSNAPPFTSGKFEASVNTRHCSINGVGTQACKAPVSMIDMRESTASIKRSSAITIDGRMKDLWRASRSLMLRLAAFRNSTTATQASVFATAASGFA